MTIICIGCRAEVTALDAMPSMTVCPRCGGRCFGWEDHRSSFTMRDRVPVPMKPVSKAA